MTTLTKLEHPAVAALHSAVNWYTPPNDSGPFPLEQIVAALTASAAYDDAVGECVDALNNVEAIMSIVPPRTETAEYLAGLEQVRAALAKIAGLGER